jgi:hypothetical protein
VPAHTGHIFFIPRQDFLKGFSYKQTSDPLLKKVRIVGRLIAHIHSSFSDTNVTMSSMTADGILCSILKKIYETEHKVEEGDPEAEKNWKAVDPRQEMFAAIRSRKL